MERVAAEIIALLDEQPPVSMAVVASYRDIKRVEIQPLPFAGSLTPEPDGLVIRLNASDGHARRRFSGFHEVGHTLQPGFRQQTLFRCHHRAPRRDRAVDVEGLADAAAAEFLLPRRYFVPDLADTAFGWDGIHELKDRYEASLYATALRAVRFAADPTLLVVLEPGLRKEERGHTDVTPKLRVVASWTNSSFPYVPRNKSACSDGPLDRALRGEVIDETSSLSELGLDDIATLHLSARLLPYADRQGELRQRVMALYRRPQLSRH
jgi:hypothetical protein